MIGVQKPRPQEPHADQQEHAAALRIVTHQCNRARGERELRRDHLQKGVELTVCTPGQPAYQRRCSREHYRQKDRSRDLSGPELFCTGTRTIHCIY